MARYLFRVDDVHPRMDWEKFNKLCATFDKFQVKPLLAVIPDNKADDLNKDDSNFTFWKIIRNLYDKQWTIAMHGYQHAYVTNQAGILKINPYSEFAGLLYDVQLQKIKKGKDILNEKNIETDIFVAPAHSFDRTTIKALKDSGFHYISDGFSLLPFKKYGIIWLPQIFGRIRSFPIGTVTFCIHVNTVSNADLKKLNDFIEKERRRIINFPELIKMEIQIFFLHQILIFPFNLILKIIIKCRRFISKKHGY
ncbi:MAG: DUF2334 domain-containing protein [Candidatus Paceibacterota bacterium]|jgi:hypothetical protein